MQITNNLPDGMTVNWEVTTTCNYACWYCPDSLHDGRFRWPDLETSLRFFGGLCHNRTNVHLVMSGGEPTLWPDLDEFLCRKPINLSVEVGTNGSRTITWWRKNYPNMDGATISYHADSADPNHIYELCSELAVFEDKNLHVDILAIWDRIDTCLSLYQRLHDSGFQMSCGFKTVDHWKWEVRDRVTANSDHQELRRIVESKRFARNTARPYKKPNMAWLDGSPVDKYLLPSLNQNSFEGWSCSAGRNRLFIECTGDIYRGACMNGGKVGHIGDYTTVVDLGHTICQTKRCNCLDEIVLEKHSLGDKPHNMP